MEEKDIKEIVKDISYLAEVKDRAMIQNIIVDLHPADLADILYHLEDDYRAYIFEMLDVDIASDVMAELDEVSRDDILEELDEDRITEIVDEMPSDEATDLVSDLPSDLAEKVLEHIDVQDSDEVKELLSHEEDTAGGIMAKEFVSVHKDSLIDEAIQEIRRKSEEVEDIYYVYVVDEAEKLVGIISLKDLILSNPKKKVSEIMDEDVISVKTSLDQEEVANMARRYNLVAIPVVDEAGVLLGRITFDDVADVMEDEASEDIQRMAGITTEEEFRETSSFRILRVRLPWLLVGFMGQLVSALILKQFEASLNQIIAAAFFIPIIMAMGGNSGIQSSTIMVRGMATGEISIYHVGKRIMRELTVSLFNGIICGVLILITTTYWLKNLNFGIVLAIAMLSIIVYASITGALVPIILKKFGIDPAIATGPFITTSNDVVGLLIYFGLITMFLPYV